MKLTRWSWLGVLVAALGCGGSGADEVARSAGGDGSETSPNGGYVTPPEYPPKEPPKEPPKVVCECWVTGGGFVLLGGEKVTFGFNALEKGGQHITLQFHDDKEKFFGVVDEVTACTPLTGGAIQVTYVGEMFEDNRNATSVGPFTAVVVDAGEPGSKLAAGGPDRIALNGGPATLASMGLVGGNVQVHQLENCVPPPCPMK